MNPVHVLPIELVRAAHHAIPVELHPASTQSLWPAIITAAATVVLATLAYIQIRAGRAQTKELREAAERQWQPRVFAHGWGLEFKITIPVDNPGEGVAGYYLSNEGTGPAFNVEHGVEVAGRRYTPGAGLLERMVRAGQEIPPMLDAVGLPVSLTPIQVAIGQEKPESIVYWTRFENLLGERFEVLNFSDPTRPAEFHRL
jgi:hypothetical protein